ncbi:multidrug resistance protein 3 (p glycoprotein 3) [Colletotrichum truncatum]|uniref:Multidrug resistance protein 3 (P glycoprotein 3) n=1 Tax=Colletotrichum truncatum TaxID=5467 RepID=A0ACC3Z042_COLTU|nr:multidrug resistance protein 3 (p glycoprotein 3) [Colletotrichum truncatum]KAF6800772.1 multidrug resistance protein 3 (p glycoprotein 3) [Colletotrichum truncatum]
MTADMEKQALSLNTSSPESTTNHEKTHEKPDEKNEKGSGGFLRVFTYGEPIDYVLEFIAVLAALGSGVALAMMNLIIGELMNVMSDPTLIATDPNKFMSIVSRNALYFVYIGIARFATTYIYSSLFTYVAFKLTRNLRRSYLRAALSQEISFFDHGTAGSIAMQATTNGKLIQSGIAEKLGLFFSSIATFIAAFIIAFVSQWKLTLIIIGVLPAMMIVMGVLAGMDSGLETKILQINSQAGTYAESALGSTRAIKAFNLESRIMHKYGSYLNNSRQLGIKKNPIYGVLFGWQYFLIYACMGLAFWQGIAMIARGEVDGIGTIFTVLFSVIISSTSINGVAPHIMSFTRAATAASELFVLIDRKSQIDPFDESGQIPNDVPGHIEIEGLNFSYPTRPDVKVLEDFSLRIPAGKVTALVGPSGSGKSTIIGLLERWYNPASGTIKLDGARISSLSLGWLRTTMRLVQQEPVLFNGTVFENIVNGLVGTPWEKASREDQLQRVQQAAKLAFADDFIVKLPQGYDTRIGERGGLLSGGQKQRIAIARSVISEPKILLLDEATSALDPHAEGVVQQALDSAARNRTTVVIAHKLATIRNADNIVVMSKGKIVEQGKHDELVAMNGTYAKLVKAQDLSVESQEKMDQSSDDESADAAEPIQSLAKYDTAVAQGLLSLKDKEDYSLYKQTGLIHTVSKLVRATPEIRIWYILAFITCILGAAVYPGQALLLSKVMEVFSGNDMVKRGNFISLMYFVMALGTFIAYFVMGWTTNVIAQTLSQKIRRGLMRGMLRQDLRFFDREENTVGALTSRIDSHAQAILELMGFNVAFAVLAFINVIACSILAIVISWKLGLVGVFAGMPPLLLSGFARIRIETKMDSDIDKKFSKSASMASETVNAIRTVSSLAIEKGVLERYTNELDTAISTSTAPLFNMMIWFSLTQSIEFFILALGFWWGSRLAADGEITFAQFIVAFMGVFFSGQAAGMIFSFSSSFTKANAAANYYFWLTALEPTVQDTDENREKGPADGCSSIDFINVQFSYPLAPDARVLKGISLKIDRGQFVAFVGASGCGKSTMISLLERFYDPVSGSIVIDGSAPLTDISPRSYRSKLALVQQEPTLFPGTIRENIAAGMDVGPEEQAAVKDDLIEAACRAANAWDFVSSLPEGLNTPCGQGGSQLSGGQRQRIAIARALIRNPSVILLDEATSALDTESERVVQKALMEAANSGDRITIAVAHRLSTIRDADRICVFFGGRIVETGTHNELIEQGGIYKKMCEAQSLDNAA